MVTINSMVTCFRIHLYGICNRTYSIWDVFCRVFCWACIAHLMQKLELLSSDATFGFIGFADRFAVKCLEHALAAQTTMEHYVLFDP